MLLERSPYSKKKPIQVEVMPHVADCRTLCNMAWKAFRMLDGLFTEVFDKQSVSSDGRSMHPGAHSAALAVYNTHTLTAPSKPVVWTEC